MTKNEMIANLLKKSGWTVTTKTDNDGYKIAVSTDNK